MKTVIPAGGKLVIEINRAEEGWYELSFRRGSKAAMLRMTRHHGLRNIRLQVEDFLGSFVRFIEPKVVEGDPETDPDFQVKE